MSKRKKVSFTLDGKEIEREERKRARRDALMFIDMTTKVIEDKRKKEPKYKNIEEE